MSKVLISVLVAAYNVEKYIEKCMETLIGNDEKSIEIIVVDDGSRDNTSALCDKYAALDNRVKVIHKENGGLVSARIAGMNAAQGEYVCCIDGDDWVDAEVFSKFIPVIEKLKPDMLCFGYFSARDEFDEMPVAKPLPYKAGLYEKKDIENTIYKRLMCSAEGEHFVYAVWGKVIKTEIFKECYIRDTSVSIGEDAATTPPCIYKANSMYIMEECLYYYRTNFSSITKTRKPANIWAPKQRTIHIKNLIDTSEHEFDLQLARQTVLALYDAVNSQFFVREPYFQICKRLSAVLEDPEYAEAIQKAKFKFGSAPFIKHTLLKYRLYLLVKILSKRKLM